MIKILKINNNLYKDNNLIVNKNNLFHKIIKYLNMSVHKMNKDKVFKKIHKVMLNKMKVKQYKVKILVMNIMN